MSQRHSALPEAKQQVILQQERKGETARRVLGDYIQRDSAEKSSPQTKDLFADQKRGGNLIAHFLKAARLIAIVGDEFLPVNDWLRHLISSS